MSDNKRHIVNEVRSLRRTQISRWAIESRQERAKRYIDLNGHQVGLRSGDLGIDAERAQKYIYLNGQVEGRAGHKFYVSKQPNCLLVFMNSLQNEYLY